MDENQNNPFDKAKLMSQATSWLLEMEVLENDHMKNAMILNLYKVSDHIKDVQILADQNNRRMLIYLGLSKFGKMFKRQKIEVEVLEMMQSVLPKFRFRVVFDPTIMEKSVALSQRGPTKPTKVSEPSKEKP